MSENAIEIESLAKRFGSTAVLEDLSLRVSPGQTFAFLGRNGAGKTTAIRMLLGLLKPDGGQIRVLGLDPLRQAIEIRRRVGYLAEDQKMFGWMTVEQLLRFMAPFYPTWDAGWANQCRERFELSAGTRVKRLSKGQNVRLGLLLALAHRPELVILDDPTLGLDPIMRKEFLRDIVEHLQGEGVSVFFSSHLLYEIEPVADEIAILEKGRIVRQAPTERLRDEVKQVILSAEAFDRAKPLSGTLDVKRRGARVAVVLANAPPVIADLHAGGVDFEVVDLNLDEIFEAYVIGRTEEENVTGSAVERVA
jgi:ABC-2 type transport system ATP-binding protein